MNNCLPWNNRLSSLSIRAGCWSAKGVEVGDAAGPQADSWDKQASDS
jgi:hypothetical protein